MTNRQFPLTLELDFDSDEEARDFDKAAAANGMAPDQFVVWLFDGYRRTRRVEAAHNVVPLPPRKPMARAEAKRVLKEALRELLEEVGG